MAEIELTGIDQSKRGKRQDNPIKEVNNFLQNKEKEFSSLLISLHTSITRKYAKQSQVKRDVRRAIILTEFFKQVKQKALEYKNQTNSQDEKSIISQLVHKGVQDKWILFLDAINKTLNNLLTPASNKAETLLSREARKVKDKSGDRIDDVLEAEIASVIATLGDFNSQGVEEKVTQRHLSGTMEYTTLSPVVENIAGSVSKALNKHYTEVAESMQGIKPKQGKVDVTGFDMVFTCDNTENFPDEQLFTAAIKALRGAKITIKNYKSEGRQKIYDTKGALKDVFGTTWGFSTLNRISKAVVSLDLGETTFLKSFLGVVTQSMTSPYSPIMFYAWAGILSTEYDRISNIRKLISEHFDHIQFIYELTGGSVAYDINGNYSNQFADLLLYNNPNGNKIVVQSTREMISKYLDQSHNRQNIFGRRETSYKMETGEKYQVFEVIGGGEFFKIENRKRRKLT